MRRVLEMLPEPYVFHVLDDFFIQSPVRTDAFLRLVEMMEEDASIASFQLIASRVEQLGLSYFGLQDSDFSPRSVRLGYTPLSGALKALQLEDQLQPYSLAKERLYQVAPPL